MHTILSVASGPRLNTTILIATLDIERYQDVYKMSIYASNIFHILLLVKEHST